MKSNNERTTKHSNSLERQLINVSEENKEMKFKLDDSEGVMRKTYGQGKRVVHHPGQID